MLEAVLAYTQTSETHALKVFFYCAFSNILRNCSIWLSGSTKPQKDLTKILSDPVDEFRKQVQSMIKRNLLYWRDLQASHIVPEDVSTHCHIFFDDVRSLSLSDESLDLVVTSPPYATCYEYSEMHQLTQLWFERYAIFGPLTAHCKYIGTSRYTLTRDRGLGSTGSPSADQALAQLLERATGPLASAIRQEVHALSYYFHDMRQALQQFARVVKKGKRLVLIIGDSCRRGITIPTSAALEEMAVQCSFVLEKRIVRRVSGRVLVSTRDKATGRFSSLDQSDTQVYPEEYILIFQRLS
jgi:tRNA G10  N-methylase Trm11